MTSSTTLPKPNPPVDSLFSPRVWIVVVGYNNALDSIECLQSIRKSTYERLSILYVDNGSESEEFDHVLAEIGGVAVVRHPKNVGVARGFNSGLAYALRRHADYVMMVNNDTLFDSDAVSQMVQAALADPTIGIVVPKAFYFDDPKAIWAAGARYRRMPPAIILKKTREEDDGRYDTEIDLEFTPFCVSLFSRELFHSVGLLDPEYHFFYEDYDLCLRAKAAGFRIRFEPRSHIWHKISKTIKAGEKVEFWRVYGRSHGIFCRKFSSHPYIANRLSKWYLYARTLYEGKFSALRAFRNACRGGLTSKLRAPPRSDDVHEPRMVEIRPPGISTRNEI